MEYIQFLSFAKSDILFKKTNIFVCLTFDNKSNSCRHWLVTLSRSWADIFASHISCDWVEHKRSSSAYLVTWGQSLATTSCPYNSWVGNWSLTVDCYFATNIGLISAMWNFHRWRFYWTEKNAITYSWNS